MPMSLLFHQLLCDNWPGPKGVANDSFDLKPGMMMPMMLLMMMVLGGDMMYEAPFITSYTEIPPPSQYPPTLSPLHHPCHI